MRWVVARLTRMRVVCDRERPDPPEAGTWVRGVPPPAGPPYPSPRMREGGSSVWNRDGQVGREMQVHPCPLCGRVSSAKGRPFTDPDRTVRHIDGSHDAVHAGESGREHLEEIRSNTRDMNENEVPVKTGKSVVEQLKDRVEAVERNVEDVRSDAEEVPESMRMRVAQLEEQQMELVEAVETLSLLVGQLHPDLEENPVELEGGR